VSQIAHSVKYESRKLVDVIVCIAIDAKATSAGFVDETSNGKVMTTLSLGT